MDELEDTKRIDYIKKVGEHRNEITFFEDLLSEEVHKVNYRDEIKGMKTRPTKMSENLAFAFTRIYTKRKTGDADENELTNEIDTADAENMLHYFRRKKWIEIEDGKVYLGSMFRTVLGISHEYKTPGERMEEALKNAPKISFEKYKAEEKKEEKPKRKSAFKKFLNSFYDSVNINVNLPSVKPYYNSCSKKIKSLPKEIAKFSGKCYKSLEKEVENALNPIVDFANKRQAIRRYHLLLVLPAMLAGMYWLGSKRAVKETINNAYNTSSEFAEFIHTSNIEKSVLNAKKSIKEKEYNALEKRIWRGLTEEEKKIRKIEDIADKKINLGKAAEKNRKNAERIKKINKIKGYVIYQTTTAYNSAMKGIKNLDIMGFAKKEKDSIATSFNDRIKRKVEEDMERRKIEEKSRKE